MIRHVLGLALLSACNEGPTLATPGDDAASAEAAASPTELDAPAASMQPVETASALPTEALPASTLQPLPTVPNEPFVVNPAFLDCVHPGVAQECNDGWCRIPAGCFVMGSPVDELHHARIAENQARVTLTHDFEIQETELTLEDWRKTGWEDPNHYYGGGALNPEIIPACTDADCPVNSTTWYQALQYANWLSEQKGFEPCIRIYDCFQLKDESAFGLACYTEFLAPSVYECEGYRLPTSAEWEYAARAGTTTAFYSGPITDFDDNYVCQLDPNLARVAWYCANAGPPEKPVAQLLPNQWGLYDILGNVDEWTMDRERGLPNPDPSTDPEAVYDSDSGAIRRGCQVNSSHTMCRAALPLGLSRDGNSVGIRLARTLGVGTLPTLEDVPPTDDAR